MLSNELEFYLNDAFQRAKERRHEFVTVEHLLLSILDMPDVSDTIKNCDGDIPQCILRRTLNHPNIANRPESHQTIYNAMELLSETMLVLNGDWPYKRCRVTDAETEANTTAAGVSSQRHRCRDRGTDAETETNTLETHARKRWRLQVP